MALRMSEPWKHPKTGIYWFRKAVPADLRQLVGKREELRTLKTRDLEQAKRRYAVVLAEVEAKWANLRAGPKALTEREAHEMAAPLHDQWLALHRDNPGQQTSWPAGIMARLWPTREWDLDTPLSARISTLIDPQARELELLVPAKGRWLSCGTWACCR